MRFLRYLIVQVLAYGIDMGGFIFLSTYLHVHPLAANVASKILAGVVAFVAHRGFTFRLSGTDRKGEQAVRYFVLLGLNVPMSAAILWLMLHVIPHNVLAKFVTDVMCVFLTYWLSKKFVFLGDSQPTSDVPAGRERQ